MLQKNVSPDTVLLLMNHLRTQKARIYGMAHVVDNLALSGELRREAFSLHFFLNFMLIELIDVGRVANWEFVG